jgi:microcystin-dependent protein
MVEVIIPKFGQNRRRTRTYDARNDNAKEVLDALILSIPPSGSLQATLSDVEPDTGAWKLCNGQWLSKEDFSTLYEALAGIVEETDSQFRLPDLSGKLLMGHAAGQDLGAFMGAASIALTVQNMPAHSHGITDEGHSHTFTGSPHAHAVNDPGHSHASAVTGGPATGTGSDGATAGATGSSTTGVTVSSATAGGSISNEQSGVSVQIAGGGEAFGIIPPVVVVNWLIRT